MVKRPWLKLVSGAVALSVLIAMAGYVVTWQPLRLTWQAVAVIQASGNSHWVSYLSDDRPLTPTVHQPGFVLWFELRNVSSFPIEVVGLPLPWSESAFVSTYLLKWPEDGRTMSAVVPFTLPAGQSVRFGHRAVAKHCLMAGDRHMQSIALAQRVHFRIYAWEHEEDLALQSAVPLAGATSCR